MLAGLRHRLDPRYLFAVQHVPLGQLSRGLVQWGVLLLVAMALAWVWRRRLRATHHESWGATLSLWAGAAGMVLLGVRLATVGTLSARIWASCATVLALAAPLAQGLTRALRRGSFARRLGRALACDLRPADTPLPWLWQLAWGLLILVGLVYLAAREGMGWWPLGITLLCTASTTAYLWFTQHRTLVRSEIAAPLVLPLLSVLLRGLIGAGLGVDIGPYQAFPYPNPWSPWFDLRAMLLAGLAWMLLSSGALVLRSASRWRLAAPGGLGLALLAVSIGWYALLVGRYLSHGVTGSDPYGYAQMAIDLAERGTPLHAFPLVALAQEAGVPLWPIAHVGYHVPIAEARAPSVWPLGWPVMLVPFYALGGERGLLLAAPACALLVALATVELAQALWPSAARSHAWAAGGLAAFIVLTSEQGAERTLVPMADAAAQMLSVLMLWSLVRARQRDGLAGSALAGATFAWAYFVRHPQLLLGLAALPVYLGAPWTRARKLRHVLAYTGAALLCALPDLYYHWRAFGAPWNAESPEWFLLSWRNIAWSAMVVGREGLAGRTEFGYLLPLIVYGAWRQARSSEERPWAAMLWLGLAGVLGFNLFYGALRLRDLLSLFPWLGLWAGRGLMDLWQKATGASISRTLRRTAVLTLALWAFAARTAPALGMDWLTVARPFGYVTAAERAEFARLAASLPENAIVGASVNSGAIERYTGRLTMRPATWSAVECARFVQAAAQRGRPVYLLSDGDDVRRFIPRAERTLCFQPVDRFLLPTFEGLSQYAEHRATLYLVEPR